MFFLDRLTSSVRNYPAYRWLRWLLSVLHRPAEHVENLQSLQF